MSSRKARRCDNGATEAQTSHRPLCRQTHGHDLLLPSIFGGGGGSVAVRLRRGERGEHAAGCWTEGRNHRSRKCGWRAEVQGEAGRPVKITAADHLTGGRYQAPQQHTGTPVRDSHMLPRARNVPHATVEVAGTSALGDQRYRSRTRSASGTPSASAISLAVVMLGENQPASSSPRYLGSMAVAWLLPRDTAGICAATSSRVRF